MFYYLILRGDYAILDDVTLLRYLRLRYHIR